MNDQFSKPEQAGPLQSKTENASLPYSDQEWITVDEAVIYFRALGLPRSPEAIRGYCRAEKLEATTTQGIKGEQHVIKRESAKVFIEDRKRILAAMSRNDAEDAGTTRKLAVTSVTYRNVPEEAGTAPAPEPLPNAKEGEIQKLKDEIMSLKIDKAARDQVVAMLRDERAKITETAMEANRRVGELETRLQLAAPREAESIPIHRQQPPESQEEPWGRVY